MMRGSIVKKKIITVLYIMLFVCGICGCKGTSSDKQSSDTVTAVPKYIKEEATIDQIDIQISGIQKDYNFLFVTDVQANFDERDDLGWFGTREARTFRNEQGEPSAEHLQDWIDYANGDENIDALLLGGDTIDYFTTTNGKSVKKVLETLQKPYIYTYGNHDSYIPWENKFDDDNPLFQQFFQENGIECQALEMNEILIVGIRNYQNNGTAQVSAKALEEYRKYAAKGKPIILVCHVPVCTSTSKSLLETAKNDAGGTYIAYDAGEQGTVYKATLMGEGMGYELDASTQEFLDEVTSDTSPVVAVLAGHLHHQWQGYITDTIFEYVGDAAFRNRGALIHVSAE